MAGETAQSDTDRTPISVASTDGFPWPCFGGICPFGQRTIIQHAILCALNALGSAVRSHFKTFPCSAWTLLKTATWL